MLNINEVQMPDQDSLKLISLRALGQMSLSGCNLQRKQQAKKSKTKRGEFLVTSIF